MKKIVIIFVLAGSFVCAMEKKEPVMLQMKKPSPVNDVQSLTILSGDGLVAATDHKTVEMWIPKSAYHLFTLKGHSSAVRQVAVSNSGFTFYGHGIDGTIHRWSTLAGNHMGTLNNKQKYSLLCAPKEEAWVAVVPNDEPKEIHIYEPRSKKKSTILKTVLSVTSMCVQKNDTLFAGLIDGTIQMFGTKSEKVSQTFQGHTSQVQALTIDGEDLISGSYDKSVRLWDVKSGMKKKEFTLKFHTHKYWIHNVVAASCLKQEYIAANVGGAYINIWNKKSGRRAAFIALQEDSVKNSLRGLCAIDNGQKIAYGARSGKVMIHSLAALVQSKEQKASI